MNNTNTESLITTSNHFMTTGQAAKMLGVSLTTVQKMVDTGALKSFKTIGGHRRIIINTVDDLYRTTKNAQ